MRDVLAGFLWIWLGFGIIFAGLATMVIISERENKDFRFHVVWKGEERELDFVLGMVIMVLITILAWPALLGKLIRDQWRS